MGLSPKDVLALSVFEYLAALDGFSEANDPDSQKRLSDAEKDEIWARL
jgi:hypothetical protein